MRGGTQRRARARVTDEIKATIIDHVINHRLSYREAGERVQPNLSRDTVASIVQIFREPNRIQRLLPSGGRGKLLNEEQELAIVNMVIADNEIKLKDIQSRVVEDNLVFGNIAAISITFISRTLAKHRVYKVPFERNGERIKELCRQYVQRVMDLEANQVPHEMIYADEAGFNLVKRRRRGRNIIGKRATVTMPGQSGANITMCAAISNNGALLHKCEIGPYNTDLLLLFLEDLHERLVPEVERGQVGDHLPIYVITWDNVVFHHSRAVTAWFDAHPRMMSLFLAPYSPFLNSI
ncbi:uncharacterized protein LOC127434686 [Myxocyprinus asiaticus]|uniref:uncharacterized protein LOC127434686 n=1 Tax=Myxocyprinus asiaticus TaxID=70543 RepID=UPI00222336D3|nr:uncharacterized protein LOC127434686 [Myxocyprinus asiaticus]